MTCMGNQFEYAIVGIDGRNGGRDAIALARMLLAPDGRLALANIREGGLLPPSAEDVEFEADTQAPDYVKSARLLDLARLSTGSDAQTISVVERSVGRGLHEIVERENADLLVIGSHHRGPLGAPALGNDVLGSLNGCACAVAIAPRGYARRAPALRAVGVGYDGSEEDKELLSVARVLAARHGALVRVLEVVELVGWPYDGWGSSALQKARNDSLAKARQRVSELEGVEGDAVIGVAREELAALGKSVDLLMIGSRGHDEVHRLMLGSTSNYLAEHARCPLVVMPPRLRVREREEAPR